MRMFGADLQSVLVRRLAGRVASGLRFGLREISPVRPFSWSRHLRSFSSQVFVHRDTDADATDFCFSPENELKVQTILARYPPQYKKAAMLPLLHLAQRQNANWLSLKAMQEVARRLEVPPMRVYEVATFYTMFNRQPVGRFLVQVCGTTPCELCGAAEVIKALQSAIGVSGLGQTSSDGLFTLVEVECAGACVNAPVVAVNDDYYEDVSPETAHKLIADLRSGKTPHPGPLTRKRTSCEPVGGLTSLTSKDLPFGPGFNVRSDL